MIDKSYYNNMPSKNILNDYTPKDFTHELNNTYVDSHLENMIINSNLDQEHLIK